MNSTPTKLINYARRLPKADLHCHLIGTVRPQTFADLARRAGLALPDDPLTIFRDINSRPPNPALYRDTRIPVPQGSSPDEPEVSYSLFQASEWVWDAIQGPDDLTRITFEAFEDSHRTSGTRHLELFFDGLPPHLAGLGYTGAVEAYAEGIRMAERAFGMTGVLIQGIDRSKGGEHATSVVRRVLDAPHDDVVGIGLDNLETAGPPERFAEAYALAGAGGLRRTAHSSEHAPVAVNTITCLDVLGCDRIDHGYYVLEDEAVVERCREERTPFTCIFTTSRRSWRPWRRDSIAAMVDAGLNIILASDDPGMFPTTLANEYRIAVEQVGFDHERLRATALASLEASWLGETDKADLLARAEAEIAELDAEFLASTQA